MAVDSATSRLQMYITTRTKALPDDAELYQDGQEHEGKCLFCRTPDAKISVISRGIDTFTNMCNWCNDIIQKELGSSALEHDFFIKETGLLASINPAHNFTLPPDIGKYLTHIQRDKNTYINNSDRCYICERLPVTKPYKTEQFGLIQIPIRSTSKIIAGHVHICENQLCKSIAAKYEERLAKLYFINNTTSITEIADYKCHQCSRIYSVVGEDEIFHRVKSPQSVEWHCPECAYNMLIKWKLSGPFSTLDATDEDNVSMRTIRRICHYCSEYMSIDLLNSEFSIHLNHVIHNKIVCRECSLLRTWLELESVYRVLSTRLYIEMHDSSNTFSIFRLKNGTLESIITNGNTDADNPIDNLFRAFEELNKLTNSEINLWT